MRGHDMTMLSGGRMLPVALSALNPEVRSAVEEEELRRRSLSDVLGPPPAPPAPPSLPQLLQASEAPLQAPPEEAQFEALMSALAPQAAPPAPPAPMLPPEPQVPTVSTRSPELSAVQLPVDTPELKAAREYQQQQQALVEEARKRFLNLEDEHAKMSVDPERYDKTRSKSQRVNMMIGLVLSGVGGGEAAIESTWNGYLKRVEQDIDAQKTEIEESRGRAGRAFNLYSTALSALGNADAAKDAAQGLRLKEGQFQLERASAMAQDKRAAQQLNQMAVRAKLDSEARMASAQAKLMAPLMKASAKQQEIQAMLPTGWGLETGATTSPDAIKGFQERLDGVQESIGAADQVLEILGDNWLQSRLPLSERYMLMQQSATRLLYGMGRYYDQKALTEPDIKLLKQVVGDPAKIRQDDYAKVVQKIRNSVVGGIQSYAKNRRIIPSAAYIEQLTTPGVFNY